MICPAACSTTGSTLGSGVGDSFPERAPFYAGSAPDPVARWVVVPVAYQAGAAQAAVFDPAPGDALQALLSDMTGELGRLGNGSLVSPGDASPGAALPGTPPDVRFGCVTETGTPDDDCVDRGDGALGRGPQPMYLAVGRPSADWIEAADRLATEATADGVLVVTLEVAQYWIRQRGLRGTKEVELGTNHVATFPWLTSLEGPVQVLQLTGAVVGRDGKALRIGAEGLTARRTGMTVSVLGGQSLITDEEIGRLRTERREDLPSRPLVWEAALRSLVHQLTGLEDPPSGADAPAAGRAAGMAQTPPLVNH